MGCFEMKSKCNIVTNLVIGILICISVLFGCSVDNKQISDNTMNEYIVNKRTGKIHSKDCPSVRQMNEKNKMLVSDSLLNLLKNDYTICRRCRAGIKKSGVYGPIHQMFHSNMYGEDVEISASYEEYLDSIDDVGEWYVEHVPTYASLIQDESYSKYNGYNQHYKTYSMKNKGHVTDHRVPSSETTENQLKSLSPDDQILRGTEKAAINYINCFKQIDFRKKIAYYPCDFLNSESDYRMPGDDCVRYLFAVFNRMDSQFTKKYAMLTKSSYSKTDSTMMATDYWDIAYGLMNLGFKIYDSEPGIIDADNDTYAEGYVFMISDNFKLQKGDILAREGHVHIYLGDGIAAEAPNFGWGRVYRSFPQTYEIKKEQINGNNCITLTNGNGDKEYYRRVYRYIGAQGEIK